MPISITTGMDAGYLKQAITYGGHTYSVKDNYIVRGDQSNKLCVVHVSVFPLSLANPLPGLFISLLVVILHTGHKTRLV